MTDEEFRRVRASLDATRALLRRELRYVKQLQKPEQVERYQRHIAKLERALATGEAPTHG